MNREVKYKIRSKLEAVIQSVSEFKSPSLASYERDTYGLWTLRTLEYLTMSARRKAQWNRSILYLGND